MSTKTLAAIRSYVDRNLPHAKAKRCCEARCELKLGGIRSLVLLKGELVLSDRKMCDCILFVVRDGLAVALAELKSKTAHAREIVEKLENASKAALDILAGCVPALAKPRLVFLVLAKSWHRSELKVLTGHGVSAGGTRYPVLPKKCGASLSQVLDSRIYAARG